VQRPPQYDAWIDMYGGEDFERDVKEYIGMVDAACASASDDTLRQMQEHFLTSCKLEHMFWDQAQELLRWPDIVAGSAAADRGRDDE
jgi:thiaminase (transcriptional activator TenA)